ncbi:MAG: segregation ATPase FtsK/SpoIIIE, family [Clostridia bacterium]|nr:segregation ATPase FtsK/SpoIIIE, family [Clostridia bacterium]
MAKAKKQFKEEIKFELIGLLMVGISFYIFWIIFQQPSGPYPLPEEGAGILGEFILRVLRGLVGEGKILVPIFLLFLGIRTMYKRSSVDKNRFLIFGIFLITILAILNLRLPIEEQTILNGLRSGEGGGFIGWLVSWVTLKVFGLVGSYILLISINFTCLLYLTGTSLKDLMIRFWSVFTKILKSIKEQLTNFIFTTVEDIDENKKITLNIKGDVNDQSPLIINHYENENINKPVKVIKNKETKNNIIEFPQINKEKYVNDEDFLLPKVSMLEKVKRSQNILSQRDINENIFVLQNTLESFGVKGKVIQVSCGPSITRYEFQPAPGVKVSRIVNLSDDIALSLAAAGVRIEAPIPGKAAIGIEVPNKEIATVSLREVLETDEYQNSQSKLTVALGKDIAGKPVMADLVKMPHLLIAGATGSGKSVCMNTLITSILFKSRPSEVKFLMIDPKMVELTTYNGIPHLITPVVTDAKKAASALRWAVHEMENRYELFASAGVKDIVRYNQIFPDNFLPYIVVLIDELADLMMIAPADVEDAICRLAQMARAAGIHLVVATQRPSVDVITGIIKANIPSRIAFAVSSQTDSRTILDMNGAEKLLGRGDMLFYPTGYPKPVRLQGVFVSDHEVEEIVRFLKEQEKPEYIDDVVNQEVELNKPKLEEDDDELIPEVAKLFIENGQASISLIQRRFRVGYNRAARIIDIMEKKGIIGGYEGSKPRQILITVDDYERLFGSY